MTKIKYRMWNSVKEYPEKSKMFYDTEQVMACLEQQILFESGKKTGYDHCAEGNVFMLLTGLPVKDGRDCYNGDILKVGIKHGFHSELLEEFQRENNLESINGISTYFIGIVRVDLFRGLMFENPKNGYQEPIFSRHRSIFPFHSDIEIIGNIYEHPNLLKEN